MFRICMAGLESQHNFISRISKGREREDDGTENVQREHTRRIEELTSNNQIPLLALEYSSSFPHPSRIEVGHKLTLTEAFPLNKPSGVEIDVGSFVYRLMRVEDLWVLVFVEWVSVG